MGCFTACKDLLGGAVPLRRLTGCMGLALAPACEPVCAPACNGCAQDGAPCAASPTPATHSIAAELKAGEAVYQIVLLPKGCRMVHCIYSRL